MKLSPMFAGYLLLFLSPALAALEHIKISPAGNAFILAKSSQPFVPWGFNYDHDRDGRLLEDYWHSDWPTVIEDFREMKALGANVVRVHLQINRFLESATRPNPKSLRQLRKVVQLARRTGLYLDVTGLGCYHKKDVPKWYDDLSEEKRWAAQAAFWEHVAKTCKDSPAIFAYDLMNEPIAPRSDAKGTNWLGPPFAGKHFVQWIALEGKGRERTSIARAWIQQMSTAIRKHDKRHLITVGLDPWSLDRPGLSSGFVPSEIAADLDFMSVHLYPQAGKIDEAIETLGGFAIGKPLVIEETFPLSCSLKEFSDFMMRSRSIADGWIGFYWGKTPDEYHGSTTIGDAVTLRWLEFFRLNKAMFALEPR